VRVGISPFGIWRPGVAANHPPKAGLDAYGQLFAESTHGLHKAGRLSRTANCIGAFQPAEQSFPGLLDWLARESHGIRFGRAGTERIGFEGGRHARSSSQIELTRRGTSSPGQNSLSMKCADAKPGRESIIAESGAVREKSSCRANSDCLRNCRMPPISSEMPAADRRNLGGNLACETIPATDPFRKARSSRRVPKELRAPQGAVHRVSLFGTPAGTALGDRTRRRAGTRGGS